MLQALPAFLPTGRVQAKHSEQARARGGCCCSRTRKIDQKEKPPTPTLTTPPTTQTSNIQHTREASTRVRILRQSTDMELLTRHVVRGGGDLQTSTLHRLYQTKRTPSTPKQQQKNIRAQRPKTQPTIGRRFRLMGARQCPESETYAVDTDRLSLCKDGQPQAQHAGKAYG